MGARVGGAGLGVAAPLDQGWSWPALPDGARLRLQLFAQDLRGVPGVPGLVGAWGKLVARVGGTGELPFAVKVLAHVVVLVGAVAFLATRLWLSERQVGKPGEHKASEDGDRRPLKMDSFARLVDPNGVEIDVSRFETAKETFTEVDRYLRNETRSFADSMDSTTSGESTPRAKIKPRAKTGGLFCCSPASLATVRE